MLCRPCRPAILCWIFRSEHTKGLQQKLQKRRADMPSNSLYVLTLCLNMSYHRDGVDIRTPQQQMWIQFFKENQIDNTTQLEINFLVIIASLKHQSSCAVCNVDVIKRQYLDRFLVRWWWRLGLREGQTRGKHMCRVRFVILPRWDWRYVGICRRILICWPRLSLSSTADSHSLVRSPRMLDGWAKVWISIEFSTLSSSASIRAL